MFALLLNSAGTIMLVFGLDFKYDEAYKCMILKKNSLVSKIGVLLLIFACFMQIFAIFKS